MAARQLSAHSTRLLARLDHLVCVHLFVNELHDLDGSEPLCASRRGASMRSMSGEAEAMASTSLKRRS